MQIKYCICTPSTINKYWQKLGSYRSLGEGLATQVDLSLSPNIHEESQAWYMPAIPMPGREIQADSLAHWPVNLTECSAPRLLRDSFKKEMWTVLKEQLWKIISSGLCANTHIYTYAPILMGTPKSPYTHKNYY